MLLDFLSWSGVLTLIGEIAFLAVLALLAFSLALGIIVTVSTRKGRFYFPRILRPGFVIAGSLVRGICRLLGVEDKDLTLFLISLHNRMNMESFASTPVEERAVFLPQCLRSSKCPSSLSPEGLVCQHCGRCEVDSGVNRLEKMGYQVFICPGSTFVKRMAKKYRPKAIIGVGCLMEVREGLEMADKMGMIAQGVVTLKDGCVETTVDWDQVVDVASIGLDSSRLCWSTSAHVVPSEA